jgi:hypothetical protein
MIGYACLPLFRMQLIEQDATRVADVCFWPVIRCVQTATMQGTELLRPELCLRMSKVSANEPAPAWISKSPP